MDEYLNIYYIRKDCKDYRDFVSKVRNKANNDWMFRGQNNIEWDLRHSFERVCDRFNIKSENRYNIEKNMIREFQRRLYHYDMNEPDNIATDEWIALMQHHGAPTRFIDFTYSPFVAAYFAFESAEPNSKVAVWAIDYSWFAEKLSKLNKGLYNQYIEYRNSRNPKTFENMFMKEKSIKLLLSVTPFRLNERLAYQKGVFLCPGDISISLMKNFSAYEKFSALKQHVIQYTIPTGKGNENTIAALEQLDLMNISSTTLFPGLDGFARSFGPRTKILFDKQYGH